MGFLVLLFDCATTIGHFKQSLLSRESSGDFRNSCCLQSAARIRVWSFSCNINAVSDRDCLVRHRFKRKDIGFIAGIIPWENGLDTHGRIRTSRRRYYSDPLGATSKLLRRLETPCRCVDLHDEFGKHRSAKLSITHWNCFIQSSRHWCMWGTLFENEPLTTKSSSP
jgi:hypothetical protein